MAGGAAIVWTRVVGVAIYAIAIRPGAHDDRKTKMLIIGGGVIFPTVVLTGLLAYGLSLLPGLLEPAPEGSLTIAVSGEQWWWRVTYLPPGGEPFELANEIRIPVGQPVEFLLSSPDVIHAFWIPSLGGKVDMIPGRATRLKLEPTRTKNVASPIASALIAELVTASIGHMPRTCTNTGLSRQIPLISSL